MSRILEARHGWTFAGSSGVGKAVRVSEAASQFSVYYTSSSGCTATVQMQSASALGVVSTGNLQWANLGTSTALSTGAAVLHQFSGPLDWVRPYVSAIAASTDVVRVSLIAN